MTESLDIQPQIMLCYRLYSGAKPIDSSTKSVPTLAVTDPTFSDLALAAYCPRKLYYRRRDDDREPPDNAAELRELAFAYERALTPDGDDLLAEAPIEVTPTQFRANLGGAKARLDGWDALAEPAGREVYLEGKDCRGMAHKILNDPLAPVLISPGEPPDNGVWKPQGVKAVAAAKALAWERQQSIEMAYIEYPAYGRIRKVAMTTRRKADFRTALRAARDLAEPPPRISDQEKCETCEYRETCGVATRTLGSLLSS